MKVRTCQFQYSPCRIVLSFSPLWNDAIFGAEFQYSPCRIVLSFASFLPRKRTISLFQYSPCRIVLSFLSMSTSPPHMRRVSVFSLSNRSQLSRAALTVNWRRARFSILPVESFSAFEELRQRMHAALCFSILPVESFSAL